MEGAGFIRAHSEKVELKTNIFAEDEKQEEEQEQEEEYVYQDEDGNAIDLAELQKMQAEAQSKIQVKQAEIAFEIEKQKNEAMLKQQLMQVEFQMQMSLKGVEQSAIDQREDKREDAKAKRISQANTEQSKLIQQRKNNLPPVSFESNEDSLDGFDLAEFEPR